MSKENLINRWKKLSQIYSKFLKCPICDFYNEIDLFKIYKSNDIFYAGELIRYECPNCNLIFGDLRFLNLSRDEIKQDYIDLYSFYEEGDTTKYIYHIFKFLNFCKFCCHSLFFFFFFSLSLFSRSFFLLLLLVS